MNFKIIKTYINKNRVIIKNMTLSESASTKTFNKEFASTKTLEYASNILESYSTQEHNLI